MPPRRGKAPIKLGSDDKASVYNAGDLGPIPGSGRLPGEGNGNPLQYSCLENPMDRRAWCPRGRKESDTTERLHFHESKCRTPRWRGSCMWKNVDECTRFNLGTLWWPKYLEQILIKGSLTVLRIHYKIENKNAKEYQQWRSKIWN